MADLRVTSALTCLERALIIDLSDGCGAVVKIRVTAGHVPRPVYVDGRAVATDHTDMTPGRFVMEDGCLTHLPMESGHWGLAFEMLDEGKTSGRNDLRSLFIVGYSDKQKTQNGGRPYTTATVMPTGCREVVRQTPNERELWATRLAPKGGKIERHDGMGVFNLSVQLGAEPPLVLTKSISRGSSTRGHYAEVVPGMDSNRVFQTTKHVRVGAPVDLQFRIMPEKAGDEVFGEEEHDPEHAPRTEFTLLATAPKFVDEDLRQEALA